MTFSNFTHALLPAYIDTNQTLTQHQNATTALSPVSLLISLLLMWLGADGSSKEQMQRVMWDRMYLPSPPAAVASNDTSDASLNATLSPLPGDTHHGDLLPIDQDLFQTKFQSIVDSAFLQPHFTMYHALYLQESYELNPPFLQKMREIFKQNRPSVNLVNLETTDANLDLLVKKINEDVKKNTQGIVSDLVTLTQLKDTVQKDGLIMLNAAFFADAWKLPFNSLLTMRGSPFYLMAQESAEERRRRTAGPMGSRSSSAADDGRPEFIHVDMMTLRGNLARFRYAENVFGMIGTQSVQLQYKHDASLILLLPPSNQHVHIMQVLKRMMDSIPTDAPGESKSFISQLIAAHSLTELRFVQVPRMLVDFSGGMIPTLKHMNMTEIFDASTANLSSMVKNANSDSGKLHVSHLLHKVMLPLVDQRTDDMELDADIAAENEAFGGAPNGGRIRITFNRPFFAFLVGKDGDLLGSSLILNPAQE